MLAWLLLSCLLAFSGADARLLQASHATTLKGAASRTNRLAGVAVHVPSLRNNPGYSALVRKQYNSLVAENAMKWDATQPRRDAYSFGDADWMVNFARDNNMTVHGHTLVWHNQLPAWVNEGMSADDMRESMKRHIKAVVGRYKGRVATWDVVNEVIVDGPPGAGAAQNGLRNSLLFKKMGESFIADAFKAAHVADRGAKLFINDYSVEGNDMKTDRLYALVKRLLDAGVPIHGVGFQTHVKTSWLLHPEQLQGAMQRFVDLGLRVRISEMDVTIQDDVGTVAQRLARQAQVYHDIVGVCVDQPKCDGVTFWALGDCYSWLGRDAAATLFDCTLTKKPAFGGALAALNNA